MAVPMTELFWLQNHSTVKGVQRCPFYIHAMLLLLFVIYTVLQEQKPTQRTTTAPFNEAVSHTELQYAHF